MTAHPALASLLVLADGRLPVGGHANGVGVEWAARHDDFGDPEVLAQWISARLESAGLIEASFAVAASHEPTAKRLDELDAELGARTPGPRARLVSRQLGRQLTSAARRIWPHPAYAVHAHADGPFQPLAFGVVAYVVGAAPTDVATMVLHQQVASACTAAVRLLGLDPLVTAAVQARLAADVGRLATDAPLWTASSPRSLPGWSSPLAELLTEAHGDWPARLFVA